MTEGGDFMLVPREPTREMLNAAIDVDSYKLGDISPLGFRCSPQMLFERCYAAMLSAAPQAPEMGWQPIETAPLEGGVLLWFPDLRTNEVQIGTWRAWAEPWCGLSGEWIALDTGDAFATVGDGQIWPTHWMALPAPPLAVRENETVSVASRASSPPLRAAKSDSEGGH